MYDTIIIGGGPAAISAAIYASRQKISFIAISKNIGGQMAWSSDIENYPGYEKISGVELVQKFEKQLHDYNVNVISEEVAEIRQKGKNFAIITDKNSYETKTILIASGKKPRKLGIPGEEKYLKKGVTYCATCDAPIFAGSDVVVIGGGNSAMDAALIGEKYASKVIIINVNTELKGEKSLIDTIKNNKKIVVMNSTKTLEFTGDIFLTGVKVETNKKQSVISARGAFIEIGYIPSIDFDKLTKKNQWNEIILHTEGNLTNCTSVPGIFAAGDVTDVVEKQIVVAAGEGAKAVLSVFNYLNR